MQIVESTLEHLRSEIERAYQQQNEFAKKTGRVHRQDRRIAA